jgi:hypothetical protein
MKRRTGIATPPRAGDASSMCDAEPKRLHTRTKMAIRSDKDVNGDARIARVASASNDSP